MDNYGHPVDNYGQNGHFGQSYTQGPLPDRYSIYYVSTYIGYRLIREDGRCQKPGDSAGQQKVASPKQDRRE